MPGTLTDFNPSGGNPFALTPAKKETYREQLYVWTPDELLTPGGEVSRSAHWIQAILAYSAYAQSNEQLAPFASAMHATSHFLFPFGGTTPAVASYRFAQGDVYCVAGTSNWAQVLQYLAFNAITVEVPGLQGAVFSPFGISAADVYPTLAGNYLATPPNARVAFVGHSLGAAVGYIVAQLFQARNAWPVNRVVTFGCPRIGNRFYSMIASPPLWRVVNEGDPVTQLPPLVSVAYQSVSGSAVKVPLPINYEHSIGSRWEANEAGGLSTAGTDDSGSDNVFAALLASAGDATLPVSHRMAEYVARAQLRLSRGYTLSKTAQPFLRAMYDAYAGLHSALGDGSRILPPL